MCRYGYGQVWTGVDQPNLEQVGESAYAYAEVAYDPHVSHPLSHSHLQVYLDQLITSITIVVVAVPEGRRCGEMWIRWMC